MESFDSHFRTIDEDAKRSAVRNAVKLALTGDIAALTYIFRNSGEGGLRHKQPLETYVVSDGSDLPCAQCGMKSPK